jgi:hypothetical protein
MNWMRKPAAATFHIEAAGGKGQPVSSTGAIPIEINGCQSKSFSVKDPDQFVPWWSGGDATFKTAIGYRETPVCRQRQ